MTSHDRAVTQREASGEMFTAVLCSWEAQMSAAGCSILLLPSPGCKVHSTGMLSKDVSGSRAVLAI